MKAIVQEAYGSSDVYRLCDVSKPEPQRDEVLVRVHAASVHADVWHVMTGRPYVLRAMGAGFGKPKNPVPGTDMAGVVELVGEGVTRFRPGDAVFGETVALHQWTNGGAFAEYVAVRADALALKPANLSFEQAAAVPTSGSIALRSVRDEGQVREGNQVLVNGAGGGVGVFAVQIARARGATVTAVDRTEKLEMLREVGADHVVDYTREDWTQRGGRYDVILDVASNLSLKRCAPHLSEKGTYVLIGHDQYRDPGWLGSIPRFFGLMARAPFSRHLPKPNFSTSDDCLTVLAELIEAGKLTPIVDRTFPLSGVADALRYLQSGLAKGKVLLVVTPSPDSSRDGSVEREA